MNFWKKYWKHGTCMELGVGELSGGSGWGFSSLEASIPCTTISTSSIVSVAEMARSINLLPPDLVVIACITCFLKSSLFFSLAWTASSAFFCADVSIHRIQNKNGQMHLMILRCIIFFLWDDNSNACMHIHCTSPLAN